jgi:hypothetical protein
MVGPMPPHLKFALSVIVAVVAGVMLWLERPAGADHLGWVAAGLGLGMIFALWLFPEARREGPDAG